MKGESEGGPTAPPWAARGELLQQEGAVHVLGEPLLGHTVHACAPKLQAGTRIQLSWCRRCEPGGCTVSHRHGLCF